MRRRSVEEVPELSSDSEGEELQPRRPVPPPQDEPRQPLGSAPVPGRRAGRGGTVAPPAPATQPSMRQPTGAPIRRGSSGVSAVPPPTPPTAQPTDGSIRQPTGVPIRRGSSGGSSSPALPPRGTDSPGLPTRGA
eukprot:COSAG02_NODE_570_length_20203_cov_8.049990_11_plen_134_part_01